MPSPEHGVSNITLRYYTITYLHPIAAQEGEQAPTPRAIRERLVKIRNGAKKAGNTAHFSIGRARPAKSSAAANGVKPAVKGAPIPATPRKRKPSTVIKTESTDNGQSVTGKST